MISFETYNVSTFLSYNNRSYQIYFDVILKKQIDPTKQKKATILSTMYLLHVNEFRILVAVLSEKKRTKDAFNTQHMQRT